MAQLAIKTVGTPDIASLTESEQDSFYLSLLAEILKLSGQKAND